MSLAHYRDLMSEIARLRAAPAAPATPGWAGWLQDCNHSATTENRPRHAAGRGNHVARGLIAWQEMNRLVKSGITHGE